MKRVRPFLFLLLIIAAHRLHDTTMSAQWFSERPPEMVEHVKEASEMIEESASTEQEP